MSLISDLISEGLNLASEEKFLESVLPKDEKFMEYFGVHDLFRDLPMMAMTQKCSFNVVKFDKWLHSVHGYNEYKHGSMRDFIQSKFGEEACRFIENLLKET